MMMKTNLLLLTAIGVIIVQACNIEPKPAVDASTLTADSMPLNQPDINIKDPIDTASSPITRLMLANSAGHQLQTAMGSIAEQNAENPRVKNFAEMMMKAHAKANKNLLSLAKINHIALPSAIPLRMQSRIQEISRFKGKEFDRRYLLMMKDQQQKTIDQLEKTARTLRDTTFKDYIISNLSVMKMHLDSAKRISNEL